MDIKELKAKAYELAGVSNTQQLKARYQTINKLNLRLKSSWQDVVDFLRTHPVANQIPPQTIHELKVAVYTLAQVSTTQELKTRYKALRTLNFSFRSSWTTALEFLNANQQDFQTWLANPPEDYKALFAEIDSASNDFRVKLEQAKILGKDARKMAESLEQLAQEAQEDVENLRGEAEIAYQVAQQAELN